MSDIKKDINVLVKKLNNRKKVYNPAILNQIYKDMHGDKEENKKDRSRKRGR